MFKKVDHVAIAVPNLDEAINLYKNLLGKDPESVEEIKEEKVLTAFFGVGETNLELLQPTAEDSPISKFLEDKKGRTGLHHICLQVSDLDSHIKSLKEQGIKLIYEETKIGAHNKRITFIHPKSTNGLLIELAEPIE